MTRKDYVAIAAALNSARSQPAQAGETLTQAAADFNCGLKTAAQRIADHFARDNSHFDRGRFMTACGME
jgi:hypothetical protein